jgi:hypothetical protein
MHVLGHAVQGLLPAGRLDLAEIIVAAVTVFNIAVKQFRRETVDGPVVGVSQGFEEISYGGAQEAQPR